MQTCETCRRWHRSEIETVGECRAVTSDYETEDRAAFAVEVLNDEEVGRLRTGPDFGCIAHEPRE